MSGLVCSSCGKQNEPGAIFCGSCGAQLNAYSQEAGIPVNNTPPYGNTSYQTAPNFTPNPNTYTPNQNMYTPPYSPNPGGYVPPQYTQSPGYTPNPNMYQNPGMPRQNPVQNGMAVQNSGLALASMIVGIGGIIFAFIIPLIGLICGILSLVFGISAKNKITYSRGTIGGSGLALTGIILGPMDLLVSIIAWIGYASLYM